MSSFWMAMENLRNMAALEGTDLAGANSGKIVERSSLTTVVKIRHGGTSTVNYPHDGEFTICKNCERWLLKQLTSNKEGGTKMIIFDWIYNYITTPQIYMTPQIEMLGILGIGICMLLPVAIVYVICFIKDMFSTKKNKEGGIKND